ncbi:MAG: aminotransferase class III-fold pyridoxal phosphate-dependent enzyme [Actinobacteria bacterium]|nr:aminotransferase class III-fold pyridoxal phosphate-dependent enzyme [Actinomycetota bacterium]
MRNISSDKLTQLLVRERETYLTKHPKSHSSYQDSHNLFGKVPMTWMNKWSGGFPLYLSKANGNSITDIDGNSYVDFALGDTGAMAGHSPKATIDAVNQRMAELGGITTMLPTIDAQWVGANLTERFGLPLWSFTLSATDANRWVLRIARLVTGRPKILVFSYCYHGSVDETFITIDENGNPRSRPGNVAPAVNPTETTRVVEFNDFIALQRELVYGDVAAILMEPALTNIGIVLPEPGYLTKVREIATATGTLLINDETHTFSAGPGGATKAMNLAPDIITIGKSIGGGIPCGAYGITREIAAKVAQHQEADLVDVGGVGGTLAGNALSIAAMRATLEHVLTEDAFEHMIELATLFTKDVQRSIDKHQVDWSVVQLGARAEYRFTKPAPKNGGQAAAASNDQLDEYMHLYTINRGIMMTPFHNMALMCPETTKADIELHNEVFNQALTELIS